MKTPFRIGAGLAACSVLLTATAALAQHFEYRWRNAGLSGIRTYAFQNTPPPAARSEYDLICSSPITQEQTNSAIAAQLDGLGMRRNDDHPDVYVVTRRTFEMRYTYYGPFDRGWGPSASQGITPTCRSGWVRPNGWHGYNGGVYGDLYDTLLIVLRDAANGAERWHGAETKRVHTSGKYEARLNDQVTDIFKGVSIPGTVATTGER